MNCYYLSNLKAWGVSLEAAEVAKEAELQYFEPRPPIVRTMQTTEITLDRTRLNILMLMLSFQSCWHNLLPLLVSYFLEV